MKPKITDFSGLKTAGSEAVLLLCAPETLLLHLLLCVIGVEPTTSCLVLQNHETNVEVVIPQFGHYVKLASKLGAVRGDLVVQVLCFFDASWEM